MTHLVSRVALLRHGKTEGGLGFNGSTNVGLTPLGQEQMWAAASPVERWQSIIASPLRRCTEFAEALAQHTRIPIEVDDRLREIHFGAWEGRTCEDIAKHDPKHLQRFWDDPAACPPPGGEPLSVFEARVVACWQYHLQRCAGKCALFITHGGAIRAILHRLYPLPWPELLKLELPHGSLTCIRVEHARGGLIHAGVIAAMPSSR